MSDTTQKRFPRRTEDKVGFGLLGLMLAFGLLVTSGGASADDNADPVVQRQGAQTACENMLRDTLKAPDSADFTGTTATGSGPWTVTGQVDAQNSFGATLRDSWSCEVRLDGDVFRGRASLSS